MKKTIISVIIVLSMLCCFTKVYAVENTEETDDNIKAINEVITQELEKLDLSELETLKDKFGSNELLYNKSVKEMILEFADGKISIDSETVTNYIINLLVTGIRESLIGLSTILVVVILCGLMKNMMGNSFGEVSKICEYVSFLLVVYLIAGSFIYYVNLTKELIGLMQSFVRIIFPPLLTLMTAIGSISSVGIFQPAMAVLSGSMLEFMTNTVVPVGVFGGMTSILSGISKRIKLNKISGFCNSMCKWLIGIAFTVYAGLLSIQGIMAASYDGIYFKTAKYTVGAFVPIVGGMMSDTMDTMLGCSLLLKNAIGLTGLVILASMCLLPMLRYVVCIMSYKLLDAVIDIVADSQISDAISGLISGITTMFAIVCVVTSMTFITVALAINAGNTSIMLR